MEHYVEFNTKKPSQEIILFNGKTLDLMGEFSTKNGVVDTITLRVKNESPKNKLKLINAFLCCNLIKNKDVYHIVINLKKLATKPQKQIKLSLIQTHQVLIKSVF